MSEPTLKIPLSIFLNSHLHADYNKETGYLIPNSHLLPCKPISRELALEIFAQCENKHTAYIEWPDAISVCREPIVWAWNDWKTEYRKRIDDQERAHKERVERFLFEKNIQLIVPILCENMFIDQKSATRVASCCLRRKIYSTLFEFGVTKILTKEEEL
jgi:hypothetical protein